MQALTKLEKFQLWVAKYGLNLELQFTKKIVKSNFVTAGFYSFLCSFNVIKTFGNYWKLNFNYYLTNFQDLSFSNTLSTKIGYSPRKIFENKVADIITVIINYGLYTYYWLLFFKNGSLKYTYLEEGILILAIFLHLFSHCFLFCYFFLKFSCMKNHHVYDLYCMSYTLSFCYAMYHTVLEICFYGRLSDDCF